MAVGREFRGEFVTFDLGSFTLEFRQGTTVIDTVIVTVLTEVMAFWYREMAWQQMAMVLALVISLSVVRVMAVRYSPRQYREEL